MGEWFCDECLSHASPDYLPAPAVYSEPANPDGTTGSKRGRGRPRKYADQQSQIIFMSEGAGTPASSGVPMELSTPTVGEKRDRSPDYEDDDDGSDYDGEPCASLHSRHCFASANLCASFSRCSHQASSRRVSGTQTASKMKTMTRVSLVVWRSGRRNIRVHLAYLI